MASCLTDGPCFWKAAIGIMQSHIATSLKLLKAKGCREPCEDAVSAAERAVAKVLSCTRHFAMFFVFLGMFGHLHRKLINII